MLVCLLATRTYFYGKIDDGTFLYGNDIKEYKHITYIPVVYTCFVTSLE